MVHMGTVTVVGLCVRISVCPVEITSTLACTSAFCKYKTNTRFCCVDFFNNVWVTYDKKYLSGCIYGDRVGQQLGIERTCR